MSDNTVDRLKEKLNRVTRSKAVLAERSKLLQEHVEDLRRRDDANARVVDELLERQRELNFMLHRANSVLQRMQETNAALSTEFTELVKELPAPESHDWEDRVAKINSLFQQTGSMVDEVEKEIFKTSHTSTNPKSDIGKMPEPVAVKPQPEPEPPVHEVVEVVDTIDVEETEAEPEVDAIDALIIEDIPSDCVSEPEHVEVEAVEPDITPVEESIEESPLSKIDRLFSGSNVAQDDEPEQPRRGIFGKLRGKFSKKPKEDVEPAEDEAVMAIEPCPRQAMSDLWEEPADIDVLAEEIIPRRYRKGTAAQS